MTQTASADDRCFFGHPKGLAYLLGTETGWAFAYYGLQVTLTLYMTQALLKPGHVEHVLGFAAYRALLERMNGPLSPLGLASQTFGIATGLIYVLPILGGLLADRWIGQRRAAATGVMILTAAQVFLIFEQTFLIALALMIIGTGFLKTSLVGQIGRLYPPGDDRRTRGFGLYLIALNTGSFLTPLIAGTLGERLGWSFGYVALAVGMGLGALCYIAGIKYTPPDTVRIKRDGTVAAPKLNRGDGRILLVLLLLIAIDGIWSGVYNQAFNVFPVWAETHVERHIFGFLMPVTWFSTLDGLMTILGTAIAVRVWAWRAARRGDMSDLRRIGVGLGMATVAYLILLAGTWVAGARMVSLLPEVLFFIVIDFSIPWVDTVILSMISRDSPVAIASTMLGVYYLSTAVGNFLTGWLGAFADKMSIANFWLLHAGINAGLLLLLVFSGFKLTQLLAARRLSTEGVVLADAVPATD